MTDRNERRPGSADKTVRDIRRATRRKFSAEEKIRIVLEGLRGEETIAELCRFAGQSNASFGCASPDCLLKGGFEDGMESGRSDRLFWVAGQRPGAGW